VQTENQPMLIPDTVAAALCGCSRSHWHVLAAAGKIPPSIRLGRKRLWRAEEIRAWIDAGCPDGATWDAMTASSRRRLKVS
jgi:predicted DNA-binding transcriptional regulator AlpA